MRRGLAWLVAVPLMLAGSQAAHVLAYRIVYPQASVRLRVLVETGHGYMDLLPLVLGVAGAIVALSLVATGLDAARGRGARSLPPWAFALLPVAGFTLQEHIERWLAWGFMPWHEFVEPTFLVGIALQLPFGALAYLAARLLLGGAARAGARLGASPPPQQQLCEPALPVPAVRPLPPPSSLLSRGLGRRGPPLPLGA
jgi:hypothetical protein